MITLQWKHSNRQLDESTIPFQQRSWQYRAWLKYSLDDIDVPKMTKNICWIFIIRYNKSKNKSTQILLIRKEDLLDFIESNQSNQNDFRYDIILKKSEYDYKTFSGSLNKLIEYLNDRYDFMEPYRSDYITLKKSYKKRIDVSVTELTKILKKLINNNTFINSYINIDKLLDYPKSFMEHYYVEHDIAQKIIDEYFSRHYDLKNISKVTVHSPPSYIFSKAHLNLYNYLIKEIIIYFDCKCQPIEVKRSNKF